ncbi:MULTISPECIES: hypothetical protein [Mycobacteroides]|uniref:hypothetical protein n=1 Tax=Mycobacteroides TaxID=670516 RepID=UPI0009278D80|nr:MULTISPECIES: hypothetical protein [Mycobacteroides]MBV6360504.1 hypothetical protein [Mycobacteroides chelonae]SHW95007.1 Uncharacterised protein [Mycobacteroides abscessus subsp. abscessus]SKL77959.1 Uncharacterised protein [Mycobacteroides abscessus subsp. abscessus]SKM54776.1 Uncharacterised protein [Mycobacteroides abscessus subsp. abscessus]SLK35894.1 Uncharacterised protein [Mycobacteroides abscessus subsp. abscessus]
MSATDVSDFPRLPKGYRWKVRYQPDTDRPRLDRVKVSIRCFGFTVEARSRYLIDHEMDLRQAAIMAAKIAWSDLMVARARDAALAENDRSAWRRSAKAVTAELNSGELL